MATSPSFPAAPIVPDDPERFASYWHEIDLVLAHGPRTVLELGPSTGFLAAYLGRAGVTVTPCEARAPAKLPFPDASFDAVAAFEVLERLPWESFAPALAEMARVSSRAVVLSLPDVERSLRLESSMGKLWSFRFLLPVPRLFAPAHDPRAPHAWEVGTRGHRGGAVLGAIREAKLDVQRHFRVFENPSRHFFDLVKR